MEIRALTPDDAPAIVTMSRDAFGGPLPPPGAMQWHEGMRRWGVFRGGTLVAKLNDREYLSGIRGRDVRTAGIAAVVVAPEYRGRGFGVRLMTHAMQAARERGVPISTLFRTVPALYRGLGYEQVAEQITGEFPAGALSRLRVPPGVVLRRATDADGPAIRAVYRRIVDQGSCLLTRTGPNFPASDAELVASFDGITVACDADDTDGGAGGQVLGYASWHRGTGFGRGAALDVSDLLALSGPALIALLATVGSFEPVTPAIRIRTSGQDPLFWVVPGAGWTVQDVQGYMLRVLDLPAAVAAAGWPAGMDAAVDLGVVDPLCPWHEGRHRLEIAGGRGSLTPSTTTADAPVLTPHGLAVLLAGGGSAAAMRRAGLLDGVTTSDAVLDVIMSGPHPAILDFF